MMEWWGAYKISETESEYLIFVRLPNHDDQQNVDVIVGSDAVVTINVPLKNRSQLRQIVPLPPGVSSDGIDAVLKNDTLTLVLPKKLTDPKPYDNAFSSEDWEEIKSLALQILETNLLDTPEDHLAYVRKQLSRVAGNAR
jgi:hypothetical protein